MLTTSSAFATIGATTWASRHSAQRQALFRAQVDVASAVAKWTVPKTLAVPPGIYYFSVQLADNCEPNTYGAWSDGHFAFEVASKKAEVRYSSLNSLKLVACAKRGGRRK